MDAHWRERLDPFFEEMLPDFEANLRTDTGRFASLLEEHRLDELGRIAHNYKGTAEYFGLADLGHLARTMEIHCKAGEIRQVSEAIENWHVLLIQLGLGAG